MPSIDETAHFQETAAIPQPRTRSACLVRIHPASASGDNVIDLEENEITIGREAACDVVVVDPRASRKHARIERAANEYFIRDLDSTNGTFVNDERIRLRKLAPGDLIRLGDHVFKFLAGGHIELLFHKETAKLVSCDDLTSAFTKRFFLERLAEEFARSARTGRPLALLMMDIDFFKKINDTHGHPVGDEVLREFSRRVRSVIHRDDVFARYGGEEFAMLLSCTNQREASQIAERCRRAIAEESFGTSVGPVAVTASIGVGTLSDEIRSGEALIAAADARLYEAKRSGRNRVIA